MIHTTSQLSRHYKNASFLKNNPPISIGIFFLWKPEDLSLLFTESSHSSWCGIYE